MKKLFILLLILFLFSCSNDTNSSGNNAETKDFEGNVFKGPFLVSSTVNIYPLDENLTQTGESYSGTIISSDGTYDISDIPVTGNVELVADGYFFNEVSGSVTTEKMTMRAITNKSGVVNINLLTALELDRVKYLFNTGMTLQAAKMQSSEELFNIFGFEYLGLTCDSIGLDSDNAKELLAVSSLFAGSSNGSGARSTADIEQLITQFRVDFRDGEVSNDIIDELKNSAKYLDSTIIRLNLSVYFASLGMSISIPDFSDVINDFSGLSDLTKYQTDSDNWIQVPQTVTQLTAGMGRLDGFTVPEGMVLTITVSNDDSGYVRLYSGNGFTTSGFHSATSNTSGYIKLDWGTLYPTSYPYNFNVTISDGTNQDFLSFTINQ